MGYEIKVNVYLDTGNEARGLVSVCRDGHPVQTVGSAPVGSAELSAMMRASVYTLNAYKEGK